MNADMKWLDNPEVFRVNQLEAHSDRCYYLDYAYRFLPGGVLILSEEIVNEGVIIVISWMIRTGKKRKTHYFSH